MQDRKGHTFSSSVLSLHVFAYGTALPSIRVLSSQIQSVCAPLWLPSSSCGNYDYAHINGYIRSLFVIEAATVFLAKFFYVLVLGLKSEIEAKSDLPC
jgi:hypothetical protein